MSKMHPKNFSGIWMVYVIQKRNVVLLEIHFWRYRRECLKGWDWRKNRTHKNQRKVQIPKIKSPNGFWGRERFIRIPLKQEGRSMLTRSKRIIIELKPCRK